MSTINKRNQDIKRRYQRRESLESIAQYYGVSTRTVRRVLNKQGIYLQSRRPPIYSIDEDFFKKWTAEMAYVLGFIITDGCISGSTVTIAQKDRSILEKIAESMNATYPIKSRRNGNGLAYTFSIHRKEIVDDLRKLGVTERKSNIVEFPGVPDEYLPHFIRGVIDGDGWVQDRGYVANVTTGSRRFAESLHEVFTNNNFNTRITEQYAAYRVWVSGKDDISRLSRWLYSGCGDLFIPRKRQRFEIHTA